MTGHRDNRVVAFRQGSDRAELARLRRLTGLCFDSVPLSLLDQDTVPAGSPEPGDTSARAPARLSATCRS